MSYNRLITLENKSISVGILPDVGGRIVKLSMPGGSNILKADAAEWTKKPLPPRELSPNSQFKAYNGHIVWLGPQDEWWVHQDLNPTRLHNKAEWPPDPYLIFGYFATTHRTPTSIILEGPDSPISGVKLTKKISIHENGSVDFDVSAVNIRSFAISWDLWLNTRVDGYDRCYVPVGTEGVEKIDIRHSQDIEAMDWSIVNGYFTFSPRVPSAQATQRVAKAFLQPTRGLIAAFSAHSCLRIHFARHRRELIHPRQAQVELFNIVTHDRAEALLELEQHAPYCTLEPGQTMSTHQHWEILPYGGRHNHAEHTSFLDSLES